MTDQTLEQVITAWYTDDARGSHLDFDDVPALVKRLEAFRQPSDRTVQVPVSLMEELRDAVGTVGGRAVAVQPALRAARAVSDLLSQPTPAAGPDDDDLDDEEFCARCYAGVDSSEHHEKCVITGHAEDGESASPGLSTEPPRGAIARLKVQRGDLSEWPLAERVKNGWQNGVTFYPDADVVEVLRLQTTPIGGPYTIRDVTPPAVTE